MTTMLTQLMTDLYTRTITNIQTMNKSMSHNTYQINSSDHGTKHKTNTVLTNFSSKTMLYFVSKCQITF